MVEAQTPKEFFKKILPRRFKPERAMGIDVIVQVDIAGLNGGSWVLKIKNQKLEIEEGTHASPTLFIAMAEKDYMDVVNGKISGENAFFSGKLRFKGDIGLALRLKETGFL